MVPFLNERVTKCVDVSGWVGTAPQSSVQTLPDMLDGVEINEMRGGIIMLKNRDVVVVMEQRNDMMSENVIAVPLSI